MLKLCKSEDKEEFEKIWKNLLVPTKAHTNYFKIAKTPLKLTHESKSKFFVGLSSKLSYSRTIEHGDPKITHKGIQRRHIQNEPVLTAKHYFNVLTNIANEKKIYCSGIKRSGTTGDMISYIGEKKSLTNVNPKYNYCASGIHAIPLDLDTNCVKFDDFECQLPNLTFEDLCGEGCL